MLSLGNWILSWFSADYRKKRIFLRSYDRDGKQSIEPHIQVLSPNVFSSERWKDKVNLWDYRRRAEAKLARAKQIVKDAEEEVKNSEKIINDFIQTSGLAIANAYRGEGDSVSLITKFGVIKGGSKDSGTIIENKEGRSQLSAPSLVQKPRQNNGNRKNNQNQ